MVNFQTLEEEMKKVPELRLEDIKALRQWARMQPHLPNIDAIPDVFLSIFLRRRYNSLERAKETLDKYLTFRTLAPDISQNRSFSNTVVRDVLKTSAIITVEKLDFEDQRATFLRFTDRDPSKFDFVGLVKVLQAHSDCWYRESGSEKGITLIFDQTNFTLGHLLRIPLTSVKKANYFNKHCAPVSIKSIYIINANQVTQKLLSVFKPLVDGKLFESIRVFTPSQMEEFYQYVPRDALPNEIGGKAGTLQELHERTVKRYRRHEDFCELLDSLKVDESKREGPQMNQNAMFGLEGSFKKLDID